MDWGTYRFFLAVAETGSLSAAARQLAVSQPTVGRQIQALEDCLKAKLFIRMQNGYELTPAGHAIVDLAKDIEDRTIAIHRRIGGEDQRLAGSVCIAVADGLSTCWLSSKIPELKRRHPEIAIELKVGTSTHDVLRWEADIAMRIGNPLDDDLVGRCVSQVGFGLYASESYLADHGAPESLAQLVEHSVIGSAGTVAKLPQVRKLHGIARMASVAMTCDCILTQFMAMRHGLGILALPHYMAATAPEARRVLPDEFEVLLDLWLLTHRDLRNTARVRAVIDFLCREIHAASHLFQGRAEDRASTLPLREANESSGTDWPDTGASQRAT